jgi:ligand-binding SRPBCC domain-containing protein
MVRIQELMQYKARFEQWIPLPLERVFEFFGNPENLPRIMPPWMEVRVDRATLISPSGAPLNKKVAGEGSVVAISFRPIPLLPFRVRSEALIVGFGMNHFFEDSHSDLLFKSWHHRHEFVAEDRRGISGTSARDIITYELTFGPLSSVVNPLFVAPQIRRTFEHRQQVVEGLLS